MPVKPKQEAATLGDPLVAGSNIDTNAGHFSLFKTQFRTVCVKNWTLTKRDKKSLLREILFPVFFMFALYSLRISIKDVQEPEKSGAALPLQTSFPQPPSQINYTDDGGKKTTSYCEVGVTTELPGCAIPGARMSGTTGANLRAAVENVWNHPKSKVICYPNSTALNARAADPGAPCMAFGVALSTPVGLTGQAAVCANTTGIAGVGASTTPAPPMDVSDAACTIPYTIYTNYSNGGYQFNFTPSNALWQNNYFDGLGQDGFSWVQQTVDKILINAAATAPRAAEVSLAAVRHARSYIPAFLSNPSRAILQNIFPIYLTIIFSIQVRVLLVRILEEKEKKLKEGMLMVGLIKSVDVLAHIFAQLIKGCVPIAAVLFFGFKCTLFQYSDASLLLFYFVVFSLDCYAFCFLISSFFSTAKTGGVAGYVLYTVLLFVGELYQTASSTGCTVIGLIAPAGFFVGNAIINSAEANNHGVTWANMGDASIAEVNGQPIAISFGGVLSLLVFDFFFYMALNGYLERVVQNEHGTTLPWHFPLHLSWWRDGSLPGDNCGGDGGVALGRLSTSGSSGGASGRPSLVEANFEEVDESDLGPLAVSITQLSKRFKAKAEGAARDAAATNDSDDDDDADLVSAESADSGGGGCFAKCTAARRRERKAAGGETWLKAVDNLTLDMYEGQITCLLGHNGAGKSTTISMLTGLYPPTSGTARLYGKNLVTQMEDVRQLIGVCPQHDVIWPLLTVAEHLRIFAAIKGVKHDAVEAEVVALIAAVGLDEKKGERAGSLSGGMKRRLSVGMALIGSPKVVFLDEPTSGLDPQARRQIWALLSAKREGRVTVLTTHFMDEADLLGDRIAIMSAGKLRCVGSSLFLKSRFGVGYHLTLAKVVSGRGGAAAVQAKSGGVIAAVRRFVPSAQLQTEVAGEITMLLPLDQQTSFPPLLDHLEGNLAALGLSSYAMSVSTLEEVFLKIAEEDHRAEAKRLIVGGHDDDEAAAAAGHRASDAKLGQRSSSSLGIDVGDDDGGGDDDDKNNFGRGCVRAPFKRQLWALLRKRAINARRDKKMLFYQFALPLIGLFVANLIAKPLLGIKNTPSTIITPMTPAQFGTAGDVKPLNLNVTGAANASVNAPFGANYTAYLGSVGDGKNWTAVENVGFDAAITTEADLSQLVLNRQYADTKASAISGPASMGSVFWTNSTNSTGGALSYDMRYNVAIPGSAQLLTAQLDGALLNYVRAAPGAPPPAAAGFAVFSAPFPSREIPLAIGPLIFSIVMSIYYPSFVTTIGTIAGTYVVQEMEKGVKRQQLVGGVRLSAYWAANFLFDCGFFLVAWVFFVLGVQVLQIAGWNGSNSGVSALLFLLFGPCASAWAYMFTFFFKKATSYTTAALLSQQLLGMVLFFANFAFMQIASLSGTPQTVLQYVGMPLLPNYCLAWGLFKIGYNAGLCTASEGRDVTHCDTPPLGWANAGKPAFFLALMIPVYLAVTMLVEWRRWQVATGAVRPAAGGGEGDRTSLLGAAGGLGEEDVDVADERRRVEGQSNGPAAAAPPRNFGSTADAADAANTTNPAFEADAGDGGGVDNITVKGLTKVFPGSKLDRPAVSNFTIGIPQGECFGLLGPNGAGKTTTLGMLTGEVRPSSGTASLHGLDIGTQLPEIFGTVGYCPQFDALPELMTGREVLTMYAEVKGVPEARVAAVVDGLLDKMTLTRHANKSTKTYSGGNKRKLSLAVAMMGDPKIIFLDEPSTGMDPQARRAMWDVISSSLKGRSIILTTHLMEECEALCQRIGIVVKGRLACLGSAQHLKQRFGEGYSIEVKTADLEMVPALKDFVTSIAAEAVLGEHHGGHLHYQLPKAGVTLAAVFRKFEANKAKLSITEYAVAQTSLEQVFLRFAKEQDMELATQKK